MRFHISNLYQKLEKNCEKLSLMYSFTDDTTLEIKDHNVVHHAGVGFCEQPLIDSVAW